MTETKQSTEQTNIAKKPTTKRNHIFIVTDSPTNVILYQLGLITILMTADYCSPFDKFNKDDPNNYIVVLADNLSETQKRIKQHSKQLTELNIKKYHLAIPPYGITWHDLALNGQLTGNRQKNTLSRAYTQRYLLPLESEQEAAALYFKRHSENNTFIFPFNDGLYKAIVKHTPDNAEPTIDVTLLTDCNLFFEYSVVDDTKKHSISHHLLLCSKREGRSRVQLNDNDFSKVSAFSTALQKNRQCFYGTTKDFILLKDYLLAVNPPKLKVLHTIGFDKHSQYFVFPKAAYSKNESVYSENNEGKELDFNPKKTCLNKADGTHYFDIDIKTSEGCYEGVKLFESCINSFMIMNTTDNINNPYVLTEFISPLNTVYGAKALLMFGFYISSVFSHTLNGYDFFPILSLYGYPSPYGDDKRFLTRLFNRCFFIDSEGQTLKSAFNSDSELKKINQKANLVSALLDNRKYKKQYDYDTLLPYYNRKALPTGATLAFVADTERFTNEVIKNFTVSLQFPSTYSAPANLGWQKLAAFTPERLIEVGNMLLSNRTYFERELPNIIRRYETELKQQAIPEKIAQNYAIALGGIMSCFEYLKSVNHPQPNELVDNLVNYTIQRALHKEYTTRDPMSVVDYFLNIIYDIISKDNSYFNSGLITCGIVIEQNKKTSINEIFIHLPTLLTCLANQDYDFDQKIIERYLPQHPHFIDKLTESKHFGSTRLVHIIKSVPPSPITL